ncbi:MAG: IS1595 family transposase [Bryobacteraceae bacterium]|jgi:transposase-like protein
MEREPSSLQEAIVYFSNPVNCREYVVARRWPNGVICPTCGCADVIFLAKQNRWQCRNKHSQRQFSLKTGTIYEDSPLGLDKWLAATWLVSNCKNGISSCEVARALGVTQKTAWFMDHRIRFSLGMGPGNKLSGQVEADETYIGGKARNMHPYERARKITGTGGKDKVAVMGILERGGKNVGGKVRTKVVDNTKKKTLQSEVREHVLAGSALFTDALKSYEGLDEFQHEVVDHAVEYVRGEVHTNGLENFWSLLKRGLNGTYVSVEPFHLFRYLDEQAFRYNNRVGFDDKDRFDVAVRQIFGKRLTWEHLTGKTAEAAV